MKLAAEVGIAKLCKYQEELCGDATCIVKTPGETTVVLSDGLGSGVKANILATLTTHIASGLLKRKVSIEHVMSTIADTLPICKTREIAYSTLAILQISNDGQAKLFEYDNPETILFRNDEPLKLERQESLINGQRVKQTAFQAQEGDVILMVSDGIIHAGIGGLYDLGLGQDGLLEHFTDPCSSGENCEQLADRVINLATACYLSRPGDDCTAVAIKIRPPQQVTVLTGPALNPKNDTEMVRQLLANSGSYVAVCGGTTAQIVSRVTGRELSTSTDYVDPRVPPVGNIEGIDLTTEGILTLNLCYQLLREAAEGEELPRRNDGATLLAKQLWNAEEVKFLVGRAQNAAHANLEQLVHLAPRAYVVDRIAKVLSRRNIEVEVVYY
jgi:hypothetical protein